MLTFYTNPMSRGQIVRWMLEEAGAAYESVIVDYATMKEPAYLAVNPMGKVPAIDHDGVVVTECAAICAYLADAFPDAGLAPPTSARGDYYRWLFFAAGPVEAAVTNKAMGFTPTPEQGRMAGYGTFDGTIATLSDHVGRHDYVASGRFTAADVYVGSQVLWGLQFKTMPSTPALEAYAERLRTRTAYQRAKAVDEALIAAG